MVHSLQISDLEPSLFRDLHLYVTLLFFIRLAATLGVENQVFSQLNSCGLFYIAFSPEQRETEYMLPCFLMKRRDRIQLDSL